MMKIAGPDGIECYRITHESGASATVSSHGGHLLSWKTPDGKERLYLSEKAEYLPGKAVRGGVPVIFPQFSDHGPFGRHGFARKMSWTTEPESQSLRLVGNSETRSDWPFDFELVVSVELGSDTLRLSMNVRNTGDEPFDFGAAFHTYFGVNEIGATTVSGVEGREFLNAVTKETELGEPRPLSFSGEVDRAYFQAGDSPIEIHDGHSPLLRVESETFSDVVIWNPGPNHGIGDLPDDGWRSFVCVESAQIRTKKQVAPGEEWNGAQKVTVLE